MEPTTNTNKTTIAIIIIVVIAIIIGAIVFLNSKNKAPINQEAPQVTNKVNTVVTEGESKEITEYIDSATTFDNESLLVEIEKEF
ncbi:TPA: hypothetical protein DCX66_04060 [Candidatus Nomurabacteria bacterium]|uniref:Uncharacterized protein n=1 Tax=Candidatus Nomurabacteria bacterium GW2011_GWE1_35_16 TaxID=1618761 RepID=A0A0G0BRC1_9BACT|nr:MAG: hypothetical protein UR55_C0012G0024 [Candidatus Nomurabacteria bacterium GW2011_GWF1_34_20]KKP62803.1 MAG: hypothetical protein UR57_C0011G0022 [Candidatus Nomurabacteria bacterium GW2011_GWE2_34_25]KKP66201.1 MAG: hypothetical protein UR64_C0011G0023 [Candidatus Nomurabacteria bacterium GW2011_GWE1_35_16]HAE36242.1 hypothetical protein [Candidatus Nomurabacteria bacterium]HAX65613.1 hypothetical protein [Candidatus Nomurabacteria bacterium]